MESLTMAACCAPEGIRTEFLIQSAVDPEGEVVEMSKVMIDRLYVMTDRGINHDNDGDSDEATVEAVRAAGDLLDRLSLRSVAMSSGSGGGSPVKRFVQAADREEQQSPEEQSGGCCKAAEGGKAWMVRNMGVLGLAFMVHYIAMKGANNLQSSVNSEGGLGTTALTTYYGGFIFSNAFLPPLVIRWLGCKWTIAACIALYAPYMAAQLHPSFWTLLPAALVAGLAAGPLWCAQSTFLSRVAGRYAASTAMLRRDALMVRTFGAFYMMYQMSQVWGNLISSTVLSYSQPTEDRMTVNLNSTGDMLQQNITNAGGICGPRFCPIKAMGAVSAHHTQSVLPNGMTIIISIFIGCILAAAALVIVFLDAVKGDGDQGTSSSLKLLITTTKLLRSRKQLLLLPITMWLGIQDAFVSAEYTASYVACGWGISNIGYVMICFGVANSLSALLLGWAVKLTGRLPIMVAAFILHVSIMATLLIWHPHSKNHMVYYIIAAMWGISDGVWQAQVNALYGITFPGREEAAYSSFRLFESIGYMIAYGYSAHLCTNVKIYTVLGLLISGFLGYLTVEIGTIRKLKACD